MYKQNFPELHKRHENKKKVYFELMQRKVGVVPELEALDNSGDVINGCFAFYVKDEIGSGKVLDVFNVLRKTYPEAFDTTLTSRTPGTVLGNTDIKDWVGRAMDETGLSQFMAEIDLV